ncbi:molecular chaperone HscC [Undibacterium macrobrachii]|jgi:molecular chaperone HscC|uniref:Molecular chaperone HscC n=1 Tax=Undibacterium macrobrachii TaxID=1119058 RepID=A0ABQ2X782_9BURK|nr:molecular chaperone HscC [Undibacterium macrobrachii]GGX02424.1 molecular chaperone HscC [Undibacterium macrobrachii]
MIIGIDLGTTNSLVAIWRDGKSQLIPNSLGDTLTPSCVSVDDDGSILVGRAAKERLQTHPELTAAVFKRYMGSDKKIKLGKREFRAEELSSFVLKSLKADAEAFLGETVTEAVITVPAYFSDAQRKATRTAGQLAGLKVDRLVNEPTAAALAYGMHEFKDECRFLVFDLGGGTFDVSILEMFDGVMEVRASAGDNYLGGEDITKMMVDAFMEKHGFTSKVRNDPRFMQQLFAAAEKAKRELSGETSAKMEVQAKEQTLDLVFDEESLAKLAAPLMKRLREPVERALRDTNLRSNQLDTIVLAGGATRMPIVKRLVTLMFGRFPASEINPDEVVAMGAAVQAGLKMKDSALEEVVMTDVAPYSLGVEVAMRLANNKNVSGHFSPIIERNSTVPISRVAQYYPIEDNQKILQLDIYQGESRLVKDNILLGSLELSLEPLPRDQNGVDVRFTYDVNGLLEVQATMLRTQKVHKTVIQGNPGLLSEDDIAKRLIELEKLKMHPREALEVRTLLARADRVYQLLKGDTREWLNHQIAEFERVIETQDQKLIMPAQKQFAEVLDQMEQDVVLHPGFSE